MAPRKATRKLYNPGKVHVPLILEKPVNFYKAVADSEDVAKAFVSLSTCMHGLRLELDTFRGVWQKYSQVWTVDRIEYIDIMEVSREAAATWLVRIVLELVI